jgi:hypothetical protein
MYPPKLIEDAGFFVLKEIKGPALVGYYQTTYRILKRQP